MAFCGVLGCFSAVFVFPFGVCVNRVSVFLLDLVVSLNDYSHDSVGPRLLNCHHHSELSDSAVFPVGVTTGCCCWLACEDERGYTLSRDLGLSDLLDRFPCSNDGAGPTDGEEGLKIAKILI